MTVYKASDFGVNCGSFCEKELETFLESIPKDSEEKVIEFQKGEYLIDAENLKKQMLYITNTVGDNEFSKDETPHENRAPLCFNGLKNVTVEGNGARFVIHGKATNAVISDCDNIKIRDIEITAVNPEMHELKVVGKSPLYVDFEIDGQSKVENKKGKLCFVGKDYCRSITEKAKTSWWIGRIPEKYPEMMMRVRHPLADSFKIKQTAENKIRAYCFSALRFKTGDKYYIFDVRRQYAGIFVSDSSNVTLERVKQHFNYSLALVAQNCENITVDSVEFAPEKSTGRVMCSVADFIQICMCRGLVTVRNSYFDGAGDDWLNVHGFHFKIKNKNGNKITVSFMHPQSHGFNPLRAGDEIEYINPKTKLPKSRAVITDSAMLNEYDIELTLDNAEGAVIGDVIEDVSACPDVTFTGNTATRIITRGLLLTTRGKVLVENNRFVSTTMSGILLSDDAESWYESGMCLDVTIRNNVFDYCGGNGVLILPENKVHEGAVHKNITIEGNELKKCRNECFYIKSSSDIKIMNNKIGKVPQILKTKDADNIIKDFD